MRKLENISRKEVRQTAPWLSRVFTRYVFVAALLHVLVIGVTLFEVYLVPWWTLYFRIIVAVRLALLLWVGICTSCCCTVPVVLMYRDPIVDHKLRALRKTPSLVLWLLLGYVDYYVFRIPGIFLDAVSPLLPGSGQTVHAALLRVAIGIVVLFEFRASLHFLYTCGVVNNVDLNLRLRKPAVADV